MKTRFIVGMLSALAPGMALGACKHKYYPLPGEEDGDGGTGARPDLTATTSCVGLECRINRACALGAHTTITGRVFAPNATLPLYNAAVFVPNAPLAPFPVGVTCDRCDGRVSGEPVATARTGPDGAFTLVDVPSGVDVPVVIQLGRWRRELTIPRVEECANTALDDPALTRLPRNIQEGEIPRMAIATGNADPFECLLLKLGLDANQITPPDAPTSGRVHYFRATDQPGLDLATPAPTADTLYSSLANLLRYDVVLLPCEGVAADKSSIAGVPLNPNPRVLLQQYLDAGGRVFATHLSYSWFTYTGSPYNKLAAPLGGNGLWPVGQTDDYNNTIAAPVLVSFPKGADFASWLIFAGSTSAPNRINIDQGRHDLTGVDPRYAQPWVTYDFAPLGSGPAVMHFTFNTPLDPPKDDMGVPAHCGRVVFSDFHVTAGAVRSSSLPFPDACKNEPMTDQEKALAFMLFDLSSCVQQDTEIPIL